MHRALKRLVQKLGPEAKLNARIRKGYAAAQSFDDAGAAAIWLPCWDEIKALLPERPFDLAHERKTFPWLTEPLFNWVTDLELALLNTSHDHEGAQRYLTFCEEALQLLIMEPHRPNFERARAKALWDVGRRKDAEAAIRKLLDEDPTDAWTWVWWSDFYSESDPPNAERARQILQQGLREPGLRDGDGITDRLEHLDEPLRPTKPPATQRPVTPVQSAGPSRNGPCPCGSGKKYKKCCAR